MNDTSSTNRKPCSVARPFEQNLLSAICFSSEPASPNVVIAVAGPSEAAGERLLRIGQALSSMLNQEPKPRVKEFVSRVLRNPILFPNCLHLVGTHRYILLTCLRRSVLTERGENPIYTPELTADHHPDKKVVVHGELIRTIDISIYMRWQIPIADYPVVCIDDATVTVNEIDLWMLVEVGRHKMESARSQQIVTVQVSHYVARSLIEAARDSVGLSLVGP